LLIKDRQRTDNYNSITHNKIVRLC